MKLAVAVLLALSMEAAAGAILRRQQAQAAAQERAPCNPTTKVCLAISEDAVGKQKYECVPAVTGELQSINPVANKYGAVICGPGKFFFSPMTCQGGRFEYKQQGVEIVDSEWDGGSACLEEGTKVTFQHNMTCYKVEC